MTTTMTTMGGGRTEVQTRDNCGWAGGDGGRGGGGGRRLCVWRFWAGRVSRVWIKLLCLNILILDWRRRNNAPIKGAHAVQSWVMQVPVLPLQNTWLGLNKEISTNRTQLFSSGSGTHLSWNKTLFHLPYIDDGIAIVDDMVCSHLLCTRGKQRILAFGKKRYGSICNASKFTSVMPAHKSIGKKNYNAIEMNDRKYEPLMRHFECLKNLGEVRATQVVATLVDGMQGHANCNDSINVTYLPISMEYWSWCGARLGGSNSNAVNLILRLFLYQFLHTMSSWCHESIHNNTNNQQTPPPWWWSRLPHQRHGFDEYTMSKWWVALLIFVPRLLLKCLSRINIYKLLGARAYPWILSN